MDKQVYEYDFSYSLTFSKHQNPITNLQQKFYQESQRFLEYDIIQCKEIKKVAIILLKLPIFWKVGIKLQQICQQVIYQSKRQKLQELRQSLYEDRSNLLKILQKQQKKYLPIIILFFHAILIKQLNKKNQHTQKPQKIFHFVYFQLKGQLTSSQSYLILLKQIFNISKFKQYLQNKQPKKLSQSIINNFKQAKKFINLTQSTNKYNNIESNRKSLIRNYNNMSDSNKYNKKQLEYINQEDNLQHSMYNFKKNNIKTYFIKEEQPKLKKIKSSTTNPDSLF